MLFSTFLADTLAKFYFRMLVDEGLNLILIAVIIMNLLAVRTNR
jgi:hypothetical protein